MKLGILISDVPRSWGAEKQFDSLIRQVEAAQRNGFTYITIGQHFLYGDLTWLQPVPVLARLAAEVDPHVRLATTIVITPLYNPVLLAEELATLDVVTEGRLIIGCALGYRAEEFDFFGVPYSERVARFEEGLELMKQIWTADSIDFEGEFFTVKDASPHIRTRQTPHPPLWLGGFSKPAVRRAGRLGNGWAIPPEVETDDIKERLVIFRDEQRARGLEPEHVPLRRNVFLGDDYDDAVAEFVRVSKERYLVYAQRGLDLYDPEELERNFVAMAGKHAVIGTGDDVIRELTDLAAQLPIDPIVVRPGWPALEPEEIVAFLDRFGREVTPALQSLEPMPWAAFDAAVAQ
jgi:alkanesulfonate monooxygenase SsuD/methylene tetrahydromethanopterin reductase-like flavin-dependent oxidoreductase (luciferase family)